MPNAIRVTSKRTNRESVPVELEWFDEDDRAHVETFIVTPGAIPGALALNLNKIAADSDVMWDFFRAAMTPEEYERFERFVKDPAVAVQAEALAEIVQGMMTFDTGRPTVRSSS